MATRTCAIVLLLLTGAAACADGPSPSRDLATAQGRWRFDSVWGVLRTSDGPAKLPPLLAGLTVGDGSFSIEGNRLTAGAGGSAAIATELPFLESLQKSVENSVRGQRLVLLVPDGGEAILASWEPGAESIAIHYPAGCCSRTGNILVFKRAGD